MADFKEIQIGADGQVYQVKDETARNNAGGGEGTVTGVKMNNGSPIEPDNDGVVDLGTVVTQHQDISGKANKSEMSVVDGTGTDADKITITLKEGTSATVLKEHQDISGKVDKNGTDSLMTAAEHTKLQNLPTADQLTQELSSKANDNAVVKSVTINGSTQTPQNGNVSFTVAGGQDGEDGVGFDSVTSAQDGTMVITLSNGDTMTIDLKHSHTQYAPKKIVESNSNATVTLSADVIYDLGTVAGNKTINLPSTVDQAADYEFRLKYTSGTITLPSGVTVANNATLTFTAGKTYQVIISGGILYFSETTVSA